MDLGTELADAAPYERVSRRIRWACISLVVVGLVVALAVGIWPRRTEPVAEDILNKLGSLGYVEWVPLKDKKAARYEADLAYDGLNIYAAGVLPEAYLVDMQGNVVHKWAGEQQQWAHAEMCDGDLFVFAYEEKLLISIDRDSNIRWEQKIDAHHDIDFDESGRIYTLGAKNEVVLLRGKPLRIRSDYIFILSADGQIEKEISIFELVKSLVAKRPANFSVSRPEDILHSNSIEYIERDIEGFCSKGDLLISIHGLNLIGVVDIEQNKLIWSWGENELDGQHAPTLLDSGNILIFDNGYRRGFSRVIELNPLTKCIEWEYKPDDFYTQTKGFAQRLPNDNTLITESNKGRAFEITKKGNIVWEFYNPKVKKKKRAAIYRMERILK